MVVNVQVKKVIEVVVDSPGLGDRIATARKLHSQSLISLAKVAGITRQYWYEIEREKLDYPLPYETLKAIEKALGVEFDVFEQKD